MADYPTTDHIVCCYHDKEGKKNIEKLIQEGTIQPCDSIPFRKDFGCDKTYVVGSPAFCAAIKGVSIIAWREIK